MSREPVSIPAADGAIRAWLFTPARKGSRKAWPAVIFYMDGLAIRPTLFDMAQRLADGGYTVLLPDMFWRFGPYEPLDPKAIFGGGGSVREKLGGLTSATDSRRATADTEACLAFLKTRKEVKGSKVGTTGYCMGGAMSLTAAGRFRQRIAAAASFHGGNLATDAADSPHLLAPKMKARVYVAGADKDNSFPVEMKVRLDHALVEARVDHRCEIYAGAMHGWTMRDFPVYDEAAAERHWRELFNLFARTLG